MSSAVFSPCRKYRYELWRHWQQPEPSYVMFIGLNPSTADETTDDPTIRRCIQFAKDWGYASLCMTNLFAYRATQPKDMKAVDDPVGPENDSTLKRLAEGAGIIVAAWGTHGTHRNRDYDVKKSMAHLSYLRLTKDGHPSHPLYLPASLVPQPWSAS